MAGLARKNDVLELDLIYTWTGFYHTYTYCFVLYETFPGIKTK